MCASALQYQYSGILPSVGGGTTAPFIMWEFATWEE